jgi:hypothetical protein
MSEDGLVGSLRVVEKLHLRALGLFEHPTALAARRNYTAAFSASKLCWHVSFHSNTGKP